MESAYLVTRYSIEKKKFVSCEIWSVTPWGSSRTQPGELWSVIYEVRHHTFSEAIEQVLKTISDGYYPKQWDEVLYLMSDRDKLRIEECKGEV